jgi:preprotein translocase subunit SecE
VQSAGKRRFSLSKKELCVAEKTEKSKTIEKTKQPEKSKSAEKSKQPNRLVRFWRETIGELRKVSWPTTRKPGV